MKIAVLLTSFNRRNKTLGCLKSLKNQLLDDAVLEIFLTDDNSSDGTAKAVKEKFPDVHVLNGTGSLFWAGGMRHTWKRALGSNPDYFLLVNDDTILADDAVKRLIACAMSLDKPVICVGSTSDAKSGEISYGGRKLKDKIGPRSYLVYSNKEVVECDLGNANIMLVPAPIVQRIGILSKEFTHGIADYDYTLRAKKAGYSVVVAPGILGYCTDDHGKNWKPQSSTFSERVAYLYSPKGLAYKEYILFIRRHFSLHLPAAVLKLWLKTIFPWVYEVFKKPKKNQEISNLNC
ncbi:glycosyltransferase family 2 protein [Autumnicola musiva]|uniref:Glycosyltransferase family 2 protein n=1 Tax=Autumnicola musiva TaxID=3075589 RepID=A0ABU3D837_9FLAO|nr:glycosyltransferase family 2 protein [Zunongwangia sp. F117]MDT0677693.1 glycosyltransferase family 2 protein [Zunongwangia sp. F117]